MSQRIITPWLNTNVPGAYVNTTVISTASGLATSGVIVLMGEAAGGPDYSITNLKNNFFGPQQGNLVRAKYTSGPIVDAFNALAAPSNDPDISGSASSVYIVKTNKGTQATSPVGAYTFTVTSANATAGATYTNNGKTFTVQSTIAGATTLVASGTGAPTSSGTLTKASGTGDTTIAFSAVSGGTYGTMTAQNYGVGGNSFQYAITSIEAETAPTVTGNTIPAFGAPLNGDSFSLRLNGGAITTVTLSATPSMHDTVAHLVSELNGLLPTGIVASASVASPLTAIALTMSPDANANASGWGKSFELVDSTPGDLAALGLVVGLSVSSQEPGVEVSTANTATGFTSTIDINPAVALMIGYQGTTATVTINATTLTTSVTGGGGSNLSIVLAQYTTIAQLAAFINSQPGYSATAASSATSLPTSALDHVSGVGIASTSPSDEAGRIKDSAYTFQTDIAQNTAMFFTPIATAGLPSVQESTFLAGGKLGATLASDIVNAINQLAGIQCNIIVPLFSQNATADILAGNTDPNSTYTIDAINELLKTHCLEFSTPTLKKNRMAILSINGTYGVAKAQAQGLGTYRCALTMQQVTQVNSAGIITVFLPWYGSVVAAGMQAGGFYKSIVNHYANIIAITDPTGYDNGDPFDVSDALTAGLLPLTQDVNGIKWVSDQSTYGLDTNFVYNSIQAVYLSDILALDLAQSFQQVMVGKSLADISAASALSFLQQLFDKYKKLKMTTTSNDAPLGYKNASIQVAAPSMFVSVEAKLTTSLYFVAIDLALSAVQQSAS